MGQPTKNIIKTTVKLKLNNTQDLRLRLISLSFIIFSTATMVTIITNVDTDNHTVAAIGSGAGHVRLKRESANLFSPVTTSSFQNSQLM